jgi:hypothetical protein
MEILVMEGVSLVDLLVVALQVELVRLRRRSVRRGSIGLTRATARRVVRSTMEGRLAALRRECFVSHTPELTAMADAVIYLDAMASEDMV